MKDEFMDVVRSSPEMQEGFRRVIEDRRIGDYSLPILHSSHIDITAAMLAAEAAKAPPLVVIDEYRPSLRAVSYCGMGVINFSGHRYQPAYTLLDEDKGKPEWQKRRDASARAKAGLVARMKKGRR